MQCTKKAVTLQKKKMEKQIYTKDDICIKLKEWFDKGLLITLSDSGMTANEVERKANSNEVAYTPHPKLIFMGDSSNSEEYNLLISLFHDLRLLTSLQAKVKKNIRTLYALHKAAENGELLRFEHHDVIIYID